MSLGRKNGYANKNLLMDESLQYESHVVQSEVDLVNDLFELNEHLTPFIDKVLHNTAKPMTMHPIIAGNQVHIDGFGTASEMQDRWGPFLTDLMRDLLIQGYSAVIIDPEESDSEDETDGDAKGGDKNKEDETNANAKEENTPDESDGDSASTDGAYAIGLTAQGKKRENVIRRTMYTLKWKTTDKFKREYAAFPRNNLQRGVGNAIGGGIAPSMGVEATLKKIPNVDIVFLWEPTDSGRLTSPTARSKLFCAEITHALLTDRKAEINQANATLFVQKPGDRAGAAAIDVPFTMGRLCNNGEIDMGVENVPSNGGMVQGYNAAAALITNGAGGTTTLTDSERKNNGSRTLVPGRPTQWLEPGETVAIDPGVVKPDPAGTMQKIEELIKHIGRNFGITGDLLESGSTGGGSNKVAAAAETTQKQIGVMIDFIQRPVLEFMRKIMMKYYQKTFAKLIREHELSTITDGKGNVVNSGRGKKRKVVMDWIDVRFVNDSHANPEQALAAVTTGAITPEQYQHEIARIHRFPESAIPKPGEIGPQELVLDPILKATEKTNAEINSIDVSADVAEHGAQVAAATAGAPSAAGGPSIKVPPPNNGGRTAAARPVPKVPLTQTKRKASSNAKGAPGKKRPRKK